MTNAPTPSQRAALLWMLGVPDAIADTLEDRFARDVVADRVEGLSNLVERNYFRFGALDEIELAVLIDCVESSTFVGAAPDKATAKRAYRTLCSLADQIEAHYEVEIAHVPEC